jgi:glycosyltransferase involved in cell wall biosynthesis
MDLFPDKKIILFCSQNLNDERKGYTYLQHAIEQLENNSQFSILNSQLQSVCIGKGGRYISSAEEMATMYAAADVFVTPSLQDNLPNTIAEAMSCGTPCVGFNVGGIPEMIDHMQNGYVAKYKDVADLAEGIQYVLSHDMRDAALHKAASAYGETHVAQKYINVYESR